MLASAVIYSVRDASGLSDDTGPSPFAEANLDLFFAILTGKVYTLGLLRTLNKRTQFRERLHSGDLGRKSLSGWADAADGSGGAGPGVGGGSSHPAEPGYGGRDAANGTMAENVPPHVTFDDFVDKGIARSVGEDSKSSMVEATHDKTSAFEADTASGTTAAESDPEDGFPRALLEETGAVMSPVSTLSYVGQMR